MTVPLPVCVPKGLSADEVRVILYNMAVCLCHFGSVLAFTVGANLMAVFLFFFLLTDALIPLLLVWYAYRY